MCPEINFDHEFEIYKRVVFERYQDKFGYDYLTLKDFTPVNKMTPLTDTIAARESRKPQIPSCDML